MNTETKRYSEDFDLQSYWLVLKRRWLVVAGIFAATVGLVGLATSLQRPTYEANGRMLVQSNRTTSLTGVGERVGTLEPLKREGNPLDTQAAIVQSYPILQRVIDTLQLKDSKNRPLSPEDLRLKVEPGQKSSLFGELAEPYCGLFQQVRQTETISAPIQLSAKQQKA